jgi:sucrose phosphorylase
MEAEKRIRELARFIYGEIQGEVFYSRLMADLRVFSSAEGSETVRETAEIDGGDALLITYGDMLSSPEGGDGESGLSRLSRFLERWNQGAFSFLHLLPFHPYSSDDGFSVIDYRRVDGRFGTWEDIAVLGQRFKLVFDFVLNHGSVQSPWFRAFLAEEEEYAGWYITRPVDYDSRGVVRPRTHPLLTPFARKDGSTVWVWTTFSADQADYDFSRPPVLREMIRIFLDYARRGARIIRLDAIAYLWKEDGSPCLHHPKTHGVVRLLRGIIDFLGLDMKLLTETNVPHRENISYFGGGEGPAGTPAGDEAHLVYNFALPPLTLHAMLSSDAGPLRRWAKTLPPPVPGRYFLNFLASHDGVGLTPAAGLVEEGRFRETIAEAQKRGALVSYKSGPGGQVPYELNCSYVDLTAPESLGSGEIRARAFLASQGILLCLGGLPAVYFHSWIGSGPWKEGPELLGANRAINRERPPLDRVEAELEDPASFRGRVYRGFARLLAFRREEGAFHPLCPQRVLDAEGAVFALLRGPGEGDRRVLCLGNLGPREARFDGVPSGLGKGLVLAPWETRWIGFGGGRETRVLSTVSL